MRVRAKNVVVFANAKAWAFYQAYKAANAGKLARKALACQWPAVGPCNTGNLAYLSIKTW